MRASQRSRGLKRRGLLCGLVTGVALALAGMSQAQTKPLQVTLISAVKSIQPGQPFYVGLHLLHKEGYHTYWKYPGIVGVPVVMNWHLPEGWTAAPIEWPQPELVHMFQIRAQGFHGEVVLPMKLTPPASMKPGDRVVLAGQAAWMCCGRDCNPDFANLTLSLPVAEAAQPDEKWAKAISKSLADTPKPLPPGWQATATRDKERVTLRLTAATAEAKAQLASIQEARFFTLDGFIHSDKDQVMKKVGDHTLEFTLQISQYYDSKALPPELLGIVRTPQGWGGSVSSQSVEFQAPFK